MDSVGCIYTLCISLCVTAITKKGYQVRIRGLWEGSEEGYFLMSGRKKGESNINILNIN